MGIFKGLKKKVDAATSDEIEIRESDVDKHLSIFDQYATALPDLIEPSSAEDDKSWFEIGGSYTRTLYIHVYPPTVSFNWLSDILRFQSAMDVSIYIQPVPVRDFVKAMKKQISRDSAALAKAEEDGVVAGNEQRSIQLEQSMQQVRDIEGGQMKPYVIMVAMTLRANDQNELDRATEALESQLTRIKLRRAEWYHKAGFLTNLPLMNNNLRESHLKAARPMHTLGLVSMFPFTSSELTHESGVMVGVSGVTRSPIILNRFMQPIVENPNMAIFGGAGSGKSYFAKTEMSRWIYQGVPVIVLDPQSEYSRVCEGLGGVVINIDLNSKNVINPMDFSNAVRPAHNALNEKIGFMWELVKLMLKSGDNTNINTGGHTRTLVKNALAETYAQYGYSTSDISTQQNATSDNMPIMSDFWESLETVARIDPDPEAARILNPIVHALSEFVGEGHMAPLMDRRTTVDMNSHFIVFDYHDMPEQDLPLGMFLVMDYLRTTYMTQERAEQGQKRALYIDEAHIVMESEEISRLLEWQVRTCRKFGLGITVMTQNVGVFAHGEGGAENKSGRGILANCAIKVLLKQESTEAPYIEKEFDITGAELGRLLNAGVGEGLIFVGGDVTWFSGMFMTSEEEHELFSTTVSERARYAASQHPEPMQLEPAAPSAVYTQDEPAPAPVINPFKETPQLQQPAPETPVEAEDASFESFLDEVEELF